MAESIFIPRAGIVNLPIEVNIQVGAAYLFANSDLGKMVTLDNAGPIAATLPAGLVQGWYCLAMQKGAGPVTVVPVGTVLKNRNSHTKTLGTDAVITLTWDGVVDEYALGGESTA